MHPIGLLLSGASATDVRTSPRASSSAFATCVAGTTRVRGYQSRLRYKVISRPGIASEPALVSLCESPVSLPLSSSPLGRPRQPLLAQTERQLGQPRTNEHGAESEGHTWTDGSSASHQPVPCAIGSSRRRRFWRAVVYEVPRCGSALRHGGLCRSCQLLGEQPVLRCAVVLQHP